MNVKAVLAILSLIEQASGALDTLRKVADIIRTRRLEGKEVTLEDLQTLAAADDEARDSLQLAIGEAEQQIGQEEAEQ